MTPSAKPIVSFLGPPSSYSHQAVRQVFPVDVWDLRPEATIDDVFDKVQFREVSMGVVPFENSTNGSVVFTLDNLADRDGRYRDVTVAGEIFVDVHHCLVGHEAAPHRPDGGDESGARTPTVTNPSPQRPKARPLKNLQHIKRLYSHPQAFGQCNTFLSAFLKDAEIFDVSSTSRAAEIVSHDASGTWAAISNELAANLFGLDILGRCIEDREDNTTRFLIIGTSHLAPPDLRSVRQPRIDFGSKSMVSFTVPHRLPGALDNVLSCFKQFNLDLTSINSRPSLLVPFQYIFFVEFKGHKYKDPDDRVKGALEKIKSIAQTWRWLGSWQRYQ